MVHALSYADPLDRTRIPLVSGGGVLVIGVANGLAAGERAFMAAIAFRDSSGLLILPPYQGFEQGGGGRVMLPVAGGTVTEPATTKHGFVVPSGAKFIEVDLRSGGCQERPVVSFGPAVEPVAVHTEPGPVFQIAMTGEAVQVSIAAANGGGGKKAFLAAVRFFDTSRRKLPPPYEGFASSPVLGPYFYVAGGREGKPAITKRTMTPPPGAVVMEMELRPWSSREAIVLSSDPVVKRSTSAATVTMANPPKLPSGFLQQKISTPSQGARIRSMMVPPAQRIVGVFSVGLGLEGDCNILPFDRYDADWERTKPSHLLIEVDALSQYPGWEHALTLRDPPATVELATMLQKARAIGIVTVLVPPSQLFRYPLLSRVVHFFDRVLQPGETLNEALSASRAM
jgi:hypothetical protein